MSAGSGEPWRGGEYPSLENSPSQPNPYAPVDYPPTYPSLPPPVHPQPSAGYPGGYPSGYAGYPSGYPAYPGDPYDPYRQGRPVGTNGKAVASLVCSLVGLMFCGLPSIAGIVLGFIAMGETKQTGQDGHGVALAGTIIGCVVVALVILYIVFAVMLAASNPTLV